MCIVFSREKNAVYTVVMMLQLISGSKNRYVCNIQKDTTGLAL